MQNFLIIINALASVALIGVILLQQGKGAEMGASFGSGASQTVFGSQGSGSFFTKLTAILATIFFVTSIALAVQAKNHSNAGAISEHSESVETVSGAEEAPLEDGLAGEEEGPEAEQFEEGLAD